VKRFPRTDPRIASLAALCCLLAAAVSAPAPAADTWTDVIPGVRYLHRVTTTPRPLRIHVLIVDVSNPRIRVGTLMKNEYPGPDGGETTSGMARRHGALAAINCDYFSSGTTEDHIPQGISIHDGLLMAGSGHVPGRLSWVMDETTRESYMGVYATTYPYTPQPWMFHAASGGPRLVRDGVISIENTSGLPSAYSLNPRTALGISQDRKTLILAVVDGRQPGFSEGVTGPEMGQLLIEMGAYQGMNFDSGGSSTFYLNGAVRNRPSDGSERRVTNALAVWDTFDQGPPPAVAVATGFEGPFFAPGPVNGQNGWSGSASITQGAGPDGGRALVLDDNGASRNVTTGVDKVQWIDFRARRVGGAGTGTMLFGVSPSAVFGAVRFHSDGRIAALAGLGAGGYGTGFWQNLTTYSVGEWRRISVRVDYSSNVNRYSVYVDGRQYAAGLAYKDAGANTSLQWLRFEDTGTGGWVIDDLYVGNTHYLYPRVEPEDAAIPAGGSLPFVLKNGPTASWQVFEERLPNGQAAAPGMVASVDASGRVTAFSPGTFRLLAADSQGRQDASGTVTVLPSLSVAGIRAATDGSSVSLGRAVVTASFAGHLYAQQEDRASGMRVNTAEAFPPGTRIWATGTAATLAGEKVLNAQMMWASETGPVPTPLTMSNRDAAAIRPGLHPAGLLIRTSGRITRVEADRFYLSDGSTGGDGLAVLLPGFPAANTGRFATVSGALGVTTGPNGPAPALKPRSPEDVLVVD
jgi:hypothetical protein